MWAVAASIPAVTGYLRVRAGRHYVTDVATGYALGAAIGWLVPTIHKNSKLQKSGIILLGSPQGVNLVWNMSRPQKTERKLF